MRYYFDIDDNGFLDRDEFGVECVDLGEAKQRALHALLHATRSLGPEAGHRVIVTVRASAGQTVLHTGMVFDAPVSAFLASGASSEPGTSCQ